MTTDLLARIDADRRRYDDERAANRDRHPFAMELFDGLKASGLVPKLKHAVNAAGDVLGHEPKLPGIGVDGAKLAHLPEFEASWRKFYGKHTDSRQAYSERAQRAIKPHTHRGSAK